MCADLDALLTVLYVLRRRGGGGLRGHRQGAAVARRGGLRAGALAHVLMEEAAAVSG
jgi:hypothetical protein